MNDGLPTSPGLNTLYPFKGNLYAGCSRGVWRRPRAEFVAGVDESATRPSTIALSPLAPNPVQDVATATFTLASSAWVTVQLTDPAGRTLERRDLGQCGAGTHAVVWNVCDLPAGVIYAEFIVGREWTARSVIVVH